MLRSLDGACFYTSGKAEEGLLSQDSFLFSEVFTFEFVFLPNANMKFNIGLTFFVASPSIWRRW